MTETISADDIFLNIIVAILTSMFLPAAGGDIGFARAAAIQTVNSYRVQSHADLLFVAQVIAFGLAALGSLSLAIDDTLPLSMIVRLRGNAVSANRAAEHSRRAITPLDQRPDDASAGMPREIIATTGLSRDMHRPQQIPDPAPTQADDDECRGIWANAMKDIAAEVAAGLPHLSHEQRLKAGMQVTALHGSAAAIRAGQTGQLPTGFNLRNPDQPG